MYEDRSVSAGLGCGVGCTSTPSVYSTWLVLLYKKNINTK